MNEKTLLITLPEHENIVQYLSVYSEPILRAAERRGVRKLLLRGKKADRKNFESYARSQNPDFVVLNGHGSNEGVMGHNNEFLVKCDDNEELLSRKVVYTRSCDSLAGLGKSCVRKGTKAYIGYRGPFIFPRETSREATPEKDSICKPVFECSNIIPVSIIEGADAETACEKSRLQYIKEIKSLFVRHGPESSSLLAALLWNMKMEGFEGDPKATI